MKEAPGMPVSRREDRLGAADDALFVRAGERVGKPVVEPPEAERCREEHNDRKAKRDAFHGSDADGSR